MRVPPELSAAPDLGLVVRLDAPGLGRLLAVQRWSAVAAAKPTAEGYRTQASAAERTDPALALRLYDEGATAHPGDAELLNSAAWFMVTGPPAQRRPERAVALAREAVRLSHGRRGHIIDTLAEALLVAGQLDAAHEQNELLLRLQPGDEGGTARQRRIAEARAAK